MLKILKHKIVSGALQFTLFIGVLVALLLIGLILLTYSHQFFILQSKATIENIQLSNTGINYLLENNLNCKDTLDIEELTTSNQKVEVQHNLWGIFDKAVVKITNRKKVFYKVALLGTKMSALKRPALYLQENFKPLILVGKSIIKGNAFLPKQGVIPGYISGDGYTGTTLIQGQTDRSTFILPKLSLEIRRNINELLDNHLDNNIDENDLFKTINSFTKTTKIYSRNNEILLDRNKLTGNIIIKSDKSIIIKAATVLNDVILIAPIVIFEDNVTANCQIIASKTIKIGKNCNLNYPSSLILIQKTNKLRNNIIESNDNQIIIESNTIIKGTLCYFESIKEDNFKTQIVLNKDSVVKGEVFCEGNFDLKGSVIGTVYTNQFIVNRGGSLFINYIYNGKISNDLLPESFCGILFENSKKGIAKWLY